MLHAFLRKGWRPLSGRSSAGILEDVVTSTVFGLLAVMSPDDVLRCLSVMLGDDFCENFRNDKLESCAVNLWPPRLTASPVTGERDYTRCEPDVLIECELTSGASVSVIGEMKWDSWPNAGELHEQIRRQRAAWLTELKRAKKDAGRNKVYSLAITKASYGTAIGADFSLTWTQVHENLAKYHLKGPAGHWTELVSAFLEEAEQLSFQGFKDILWIEPIGEHVFFIDNTQWFRFPELIVSPTQNWVFYSSEAV